MSLVLVKPSIAELRELIGAVKYQDKESSSFSLYPEGFRPGTLIEITGQGKTEFVSEFLKEKSEFKTVWIESEFTINPYAFFQKGVKLENVLFVEAKKEMTWCMAQCLQSDCFKILVTHGQNFQERELRRFQLLCEKAKTHLFILSQTPHKSWVPYLQLEVNKKSSSFEVKTLRKRGHS